MRDGAEAARDHGVNLAFFGANAAYRQIRFEPSSIGPDRHQVCYKAANEIYDDLSKTNPHFNKLYASLSAFRNESLAWNQVAELSYDSFMI